MIQTLPPKTQKKAITGVIGIGVLLVAYIIHTIRKKSKLQAINKPRSNYKKNKKQNIKKELIRLKSIRSKLPDNKKVKNIYTSVIKQLIKEYKK